MKSNIIKSIIAGVIVAGAMVTTGVIAYHQGWDKGYDEGWEFGAFQVEASFGALLDCEDSECLYDAIQSIREPRTDSEIWEAYHDCDMYGLPEYAREQCNK